MSRTLRRRYRAECCRPVAGVDSCPGHLCISGSTACWRQTAQATAVAREELGGRNRCYWWTFLPTERRMPGKRIQFDDATWHALDLLAKDSMKDFQELAEEA